MENEGRKMGSYAAVVGASKSTSQNNLEPVLDNWEEAADGDQSQLLERNIEEKLDKMKQQQKSSVKSNDLGDDEAKLRTSTKQSTGDSQNSLLNTSNSSSGPPIRILKRPQSSGYLPQQNSNTATVNSVNAVVPVVPIHAANSDGGGAGGIINAKNGTSRSNYQQQQRTLQERASAYAEARMRIFGVADEEIHNDLPVQPQLSTMPQRSNNSSPGGSNGTR